MLAFGVAVASGCSKASPHPTVSADDLCLTNLTELSFRLRYYSWDHADHFPPSLALLDRHDTNSELGIYLARTGGAGNWNVFVCPATGNKPHLGLFIERWTDYIYFANERFVPNPVPILICPPENHGNRFGHVLWQDGQRTRLPADKVRALIEDLSSVATNARLNDVIVLVPERLRNIYTNVYNPLPSTKEQGPNP